MRRVLSAGIAALPLLSCTQEKAVTPNVVFVLADDLGYGDLGCFGQEHFRTPNIDRLALQGKIFTQHYAGSSVSAPSRSCLITGQHTGHTPIRGNMECEGEGQYPVPKDLYSIFSLFKAKGYSTGVFGKWGLGAPGTSGAPENQGVDEFYGYNCQRLAHNYYPYHLWHNNRKVTLEGNKGDGEGEYAPYLIHDKAMDFIRSNAGHPFFLWYTTVIPHAELRLPAKEIAPFISREELSPDKAFKGCDSGPSYKNGGYGSQSDVHAAFAAMVSLLDRQVGEISDLLDSLGIADNTIFIFTSDNGPHIEGGADPYFFNSNGPFRGLKRDLYEGGIRVPFIVRWPSAVKPGTKSDHVSAFWDFLPTMGEILGEDMPEDIDGISYLPELTGRPGQKEHPYLYWEFHEAGGRQAVRKGDWKAVRYNVAGDGDIRLYNLAGDVAEQDDLADEYPGTVAEMDSLMRVSRTESALFDFGVPGR